MPDFKRAHGSMAPVSEFKMLTECQPFKLTTDARGTEKQSIMSLKQIATETETEALHQASQFKARDVPDFNKLRRAQSVTPRRRATIMAAAPPLASEIRCS